MAFVEVGDESVMCRLPVEQLAGQLVRDNRIGAALDAIGNVLQDREFSRQRQSVIAANAELRERELIKMASLSVAFAEALRRRGVADPAASLAAEAGVAVFRVAFERWVSEPGDRNLSQIMRESLDQLKALAAS